MNRIKRFLRQPWHRYKAAKAIGWWNVRKCWNARYHHSVPTWHHKGRHE